MTLLTWWLPQSPHHGKDAVLCDGAVRTGKTVCMTLSFVAWACHTFTDTSFALCGKTIASLRRNVIRPILPMLKQLGFSCTEKLSQNYIDIAQGNSQNRFYLFGGRDESSASLIQGMTLGGVMLDEVALMPRSFVEQALARCSVEGSRLWFNCNPDTPMHWFYREWIEKAEEKNCLYLHFTMHDNPALSKKMIARYESLYSGAFYQRFVEGKWVAAQGLVYPMFDPVINVGTVQGTPCEYYISCDYGTVNPSSFGLWGRVEGKWYRMAEYYFDSRQRGEQRTDEEHYAALEALAGDRPVKAVIVDPSAASFITCIRRHGRFRVLPAENDVITGIRLVAQMLKTGQIMIDPACTDCIREFGLYRWDDRYQKDAPRKVHDHAMDDVRYFASTVAAKSGESFFAAAVRR